MSSRAQVCAWMAAVVLLAPAPAVAQERTEQEIVELALKDGPQATAIRSGVEVVRREQLARVAYPNPSITYSREGAGFTEFLQAEQVLPIFGIRGALSRAGVTATAAAEAERDVRLWELRSDVAASVARMLGYQERLSTAENHAREIERIVEILRTREREGEGSRFDRLRAEEELHEARLILMQARASIAEARAAVIALLPPMTLSRVIPNVRPPLEIAGADGLINNAGTTKPELRALALSAQRATQEADAARKSRLPAPAVFGGLKRAGTGSGHATGGVFGVTVGLPLFDSGDQEAARWTAERTRIDAERASLEARIRGQITGAREVLLIRQSALAQPASAAEDLARIAEVAYREGEVGILELLDAVRTAARAQMRHIELQLDARLAEIALERALGASLWP